MIRKLIVVLVVVAAALWYLRDPAWLPGVESGLRPWEQDASGVRYRWSGGHASFFVPSDAAAIQLPVSTTFGRDDARPMLVTATVDDGTPLRVVLHDDRWYPLTLQLPPRQSRRVRRIDIRTNITRGDNHGVRVGEVQVIRVPVAAWLRVIVPAGILFAESPGRRLCRPSRNACARSRSPRTVDRKSFAPSNAPSRIPAPARC